MDGVVHNNWIMGHLLFQNISKTNLANRNGIFSACMCHTHGLKATFPSQAIDDDEWELPTE